MRPARSNYSTDCAVGDVEETRLLRDPEETKRFSSNANYVGLNLVEPLITC